MTTIIGITLAAGAALAFVGCVVAGLIQAARMQFEDDPTGKENVDG